MLVNRVHKPSHCKICGSTSQIKVCKCQKVYYCSKNCQKIDWKTHKSECYNLVEFPNTHRPICTRNDQMNNSEIISGSQVSSANLHQQGYICARVGQHEFQSPQHQQTFDTNTNNQKTESPPCSATADEFEENLFNSLLFSVDEGTEREILQNLDIADEDLLKVCQFDTEISFPFDDQTISETISENLPDFNLINSCTNNQQSSFEEEILEAIQRKKSFEYQPEAQILLRETRENLEKELSMFREINLCETKQQEIDGGNSDDVSKVMLYKNNPKYQPAGKIEDYLQR